MGASERPARPSPLLKVLREHSREVLLAGGAFVANNVCFYIAITYAVAYGTATVGISREVMLFAVMVGSVVMIPALILCGALSDRFGRRGIFLLGAILSGFWAFADLPAHRIRVAARRDPGDHGRAFLRQPDVWPAGGAVRRALSQGRALLGRIARIPDRFGGWRRLRTDHCDGAVRRAIESSGPIAIYLGVMCRYR